MTRFEHTATCRDCGVLLFWPYPEGAALRPPAPTAGRKAEVRAWYSASAFLNHVNFTNMLRFTMDGGHAGQPVDILDYGVHGLETLNDPCRLL